MPCGPWGHGRTLQSQWQANLGVKVDLVGSDTPTLFKDGAAKSAPMLQETWRGDVDHPYIWFDNLFTCAQAPPGQRGWEAYRNPAMDKLVERADWEAIDKALPLYQQAGQQMVDDAVDGVLYYNTFVFLTKPYVQGAGHNAINDFSWTSISIARH
jgi:ABC-type oligopeptide transport system substrate-binding subunit